jgi:hypothetical protein
LPHTVLKSIMFGAAKDSEKIEPTSGSHLHMVSFNVENSKTENTFFSRLLYL